MLGQKVRRAVRSVVAGRGGRKTEEPSELRMLWNVVVKSASKQ
jgi:hypothetical protein